MNWKSFQIVAVFLAGLIAGYSGILILLHHVSEPLTQSVRFAWYDWFMYVAYPGFTLASCFIDVYSPVAKDFTMTAIAFANGVVFSTAWFVFLLTSHLARKVRKDSSKAPPHERQTCL